MSEHSYPCGGNLMNEKEQKKLLPLSGLASEACSFSTFSSYSLITKIIRIFLVGSLVQNKGELCHRFSEKQLKGSRISVQFSSVAQSCPTLCDPMNLSMPGLPVHHQLPEFTQTHVHWVGDAIQPSHPLSSPSPPAPNPSQHQVFSNESALRMRWPKYWSFKEAQIKLTPLLKWSWGRWWCW